MRGDVNIFCKFSLAAVALLLFGCAGGQNNSDKHLSTPITAVTNTPVSQAIADNTPAKATDKPLSTMAQRPSETNSDTTSLFPTTPLKLDQQQPVNRVETTPAVADSHQAMHRTDLWQRIRAGFALPDINSRFVTLQEQWLSKRPDYVARLLQRAKRYLPYIVEQVAERGMPMEIALLPAIESAYRPAATSRARAAGLWQFMPATGKHFGLKQNWWLDQRRGLVASTNAALNYLDYLQQRFKGDWVLAQIGRASCRERV